jgi:hypothetical protein
MVKRIRNDEDDEKQIEIPIPKKPKLGSESKEEQTIYAIYGPYDIPTTFIVSKMDGL